MHRHRVVQAVAFAAALVMAPRAEAVPPPFPGVVTTTIASTDGDTVIPDDGSFLSTLDVGGLSGRIVDVDVTVDVTHTQANQLDIVLVAPSGTTVTLTTDNGGTNDDVFAGTIFDDQAPGTPAPPNVRNFAYIDGAPTGPIQPEEALGALAGEDPNGLWALVIVDDAGGQQGTLRSWSLTISTLPVFRPSPPVTFTGGGATIPNNNLTGVGSSVIVSGLGPRVQDVDVTVDITHPNAADIDLFLTSPSGRRIDLVTDVGGANDNLYVGTTFDDQAGTPIADLPLPPDGTAFTAVVPEGALSAFLGEDPNGTWTLTAVDDASGNTGRLNGWMLAVSASTCGDGVLDTGEACDDGNLVPGDGCEPDCTIAVPRDGCPGCAPSELHCDDCMDDDGNGLADAADPACHASGFRLTSGTVSFPRGLTRAGLRAGGTLAVTPAAASPVGLLLADGNGMITCAALGALEPVGGRALVARGQVAGGRVSVKLRPDGRFIVRGKTMDLHGLDDASVTVGLRVGESSFVSAVPFRPWGRVLWVYP